MFELSQIYPEILYFAKQNSTNGLKMSTYPRYEKQPNRVLQPRNIGVQTVSPTVDVHPVVAFWVCSTDGILESPPVYMTYVSFNRYIWLVLWNMFIHYFFLTFHIFHMGMSSSQLTFTPSFFNHQPGHWSNSMLGRGIAFGTWSTKGWEPQVKIRWCQ